MAVKLGGRSAVALAIGVLGGGGVFALSALARTVPALHPAEGAVMIATRAPLGRQVIHHLTTLDQPGYPPLPEYPRPQLTRRAWLSLNGYWQFQGAQRPTPAPVGRDLAGRILVPFSPESQLSGVGRHYDDMWYRRSFSIPLGWRAARGCRGAGCSRVVLRFGAVNYAARVYINGALVKTHVGGYGSFSVDITRFLHQSGPQEILVQATNQVEHNPIDQVVGKQRQGAAGPIYLDPSSGIWQTVWLEPAAAARITRLALTPDLARGTLRLTASTTGGGRQQINAVAYDGAHRAGRVGGAPYVSLSMPVRKSRLWSPSHPFLYRLSVSLLVNGHRVDRVGSYFGMRSISVGRYAGAPHVLLNGKFVFELGTLDQGYWPQSGYTAPTDSALKRDLAQIKALGFNAVRVHMKVEPERFYYWADRMGLLVWQDMPALARYPTGAHARRQFEAELYDMVTGLGSHPSIVSWAPFNEDWGQYDAGRIAAEVKAWDPSRLVDADSGGICCAAPPGGDLNDRHRYVDPSHFIPSDTRATVEGEFGGLGLFVAGHTWEDRGWSYRSEPDEFTLDRDYVQLLSEVRGLEQTCGLSAAFYTQLYDTQREVDGLETYDRQLLKVAPAQVRAANRAVLDAAGSVSAPAGAC